MWPVLVATAPQLCSAALLLAPAIPVHLTVKTTSSLLASWLPPQGLSAAALACIAGYKAGPLPRLCCCFFISEMFEWRTVKTPPFGFSNLLFLLSIFDSTKRTDMKGERGALQ